MSSRSGRRRSRSRTMVSCTVRSIYIKSVSRRASSRSSDASVTRKSRFERAKGEKEKLGHLILLAETNEGYQNLIKICSKAWTEGYFHKPRVDHELLTKYHKGLIGLSACVAGELPQAILGEYPGAIENTAKIAERCHVTFTFGDHKLPSFDVPEGETSKSYLRKLCEAAIPERYPESTGKEQERLDYELGVINQMGFSDYFLIVMDFIRYAKTHGIPIGPGRGSVAGSIVAYLLHITEIDPLRFDLLFERFLNPERVSMPDIDTDLCYRRRGQVIAYLAEKYGAEQVAQIITFGTLAARAVIRDVGRVMNLPLREVDKIAKMVPSGPGVTLKKTLDGSKEFKDLYESNATVRTLIDHCLDLEGLSRNSGTHAAGVVICSKPVDEYVPI